jgi:spoIIIJ-associated protein
MADSPGKAGQEWLQKLLAFCDIAVGVDEGMPPAAADRLQAVGGHWLTLDHQALSEAQRAVFLADNGKVLDAMQYLINATLHLTQDVQDVYTVELEGFRERRYLELLEMAEQVAEQVRAAGAEVEMDPLPPAERRLIHTILGDAPDLSTFSRGQEPQRRLVVCPAGEKPEVF